IIHLNRCQDRNLSFGSRLLCFLGCPPGFLDFVKPVLSDYCVYVPQQYGAISRSSDRSPPHMRNCSSDISRVVIRFLKFRRAKRREPWPPFSFQPSSNGLGENGTGGGMLMPSDPAHGPYVIRQMTNVVREPAGRLIERLF